MRIAQLKDTGIDLFVSGAFAEAEFCFSATIDGKTTNVCVVLDMESTIKVLQTMDEGPKAMDRLSRFNTFWANVIKRMKK